MTRISIEECSFPKYDDIDVINSWEWMMSFLSDTDWKKRKSRIEQELIIEFRTTVPFSEPPVYTKILAENKTMEIARQYPEWIVIGADTIVVIDGLILGKPSSKSEARKMLAMLSGRTHKVFTAYCVAFLSKNKTYSESIFTEVTFKSLSDAEIEWYVCTDEPYDKAGAYALQGKGVFMAESLKGSYTNVIGLPVSHVMSHLLEQGFINY